MRILLRSRRGFTLIELLVVIAIIAVLIGLLLPAVQKVRESAARSSCSNNIKQIALACHAYQDNNQGFLPVSAGAGYNYNPTSANCWSWMARVLPYVEQGNLYQACGIATGATINAAGANAAAPVKTFLCPSDQAINGQPRTDEANIGSSFNYGGPAKTVGQTNYKGVCGMNWAWGTYSPVRDPRTGNTNGLDAGDGIFYRSDGDPNTGGHGKISLTMIKDGTSSTFMIGEDIPALNVHCDWVFFNHATGTCAIPLNSAMQTGQPGYNNPTDWPNVYSFRSQHPNGANFAMADASVQYVSQTINLQLYRALATYNGGEIAALP
jgi:prepilin-type N-terminal cleavage/methylation domain-containing protein/prepilin-type processing-associated H-X9-DG protein